LNYSEFFQQFYGGRSTGAIVGNKSKEKIPEFIMLAAVGEGRCDMLPTSGSAYAKWFEGTRSPDGAIWETVTMNFDELAFSRKLARNINENMLTEVATRFGITLADGERVDKDLFVIAAAKQFYAIAKGNGIADSILAGCYRDDVNVEAFPGYAAESLKKYEKMKTLLYSSEERPFDEFFVCNTVTTDRMRFRRRRRGGSDGEEVIDNVNLEKLLGLSKWTLLVGMGGIGKSMMMRHLFLESIREYKKTGLLPILVTLREFTSDNSDLFTLIMKNVNRFDDSFSSSHLHKLLKSGTCQLLLDGLDEIRYTELEAFQRQLDELVDRYPENQCVMSTRKFSSFVELPRFRIAWMLPFSPKQSLELIDRLDFCSEEPKLKKEFRDKLESDYLKTHQSFVSNPLLLTLMLMNFRRFSDVPEKRYLFYQQAYETLLYRHDADKLAYKRVFRSVGDPSDFTEVFREFCAKSYRHGDYEFNQPLFESYFDKLHKKDAVRSDSLTAENFLFDILHSVCLMYEESQSYHFLHRSFQEYFFADYYARQDDTTLRKLGKSLCKDEQNFFDESYGFDMLFELDSKKVEEFIILPYLTDIFSGKDEKDAYIDFLKRGFDSFVFTWLDKKAIKEHQFEIGNLPQSVDEPSNTVMHFILKYNHFEPAFQVDTVSLDAAPKAKPFISMFAQKTIEPRKGEQILRISRLPYEMIERDPEFVEAIMNEGLEPGKVEKAVIIGGEYIIAYDAIFAEPEKYAPLIELLNRESAPVRQQYYGVKRYYDALVEKYAEKPEDEEDDDY